MARSPRRIHFRDRNRTMPVPNVFPYDDGPVLPQSTRNLVDEVARNQCHPGLQLDKLPPVGDGKMEAQKDALAKVVEIRGDSELLEALLTRRRNMLNDLGARGLPMTTRGPLTLHLSRSGALENAGIALHPVYGFAYLPGSGVKGLVRAWAETVWAPSQPDKEKAWRRIEEVFGWSPNSEKHKFPQPKKGLPEWRPSDQSARPGASVGRLIFHDAWPTRWPCLVLDVVNNHHPEYYDGKDDPGDWEDPKLAYFLAVGRDQRFQFAISDREQSANDDLLETACGWLREALTIEGAGAKTAAGYGRFKSTEGEAPVTVSPAFTQAGFASEAFDLKLVTPAFLAGAEQKKEDCDLRPATLHGLLRWWWRTMHAAHLDRKTLKQLETAVWGDWQSGSPVRIAVDRVEDREAQQYDYKDKFRPKAEFKSQNELESPPNQKTTQGLFYASYGMDDGSRDNRKQRWYRPVGSAWRVTLTCRGGRYGTTDLSSSLVQGQVKAALWLLCRYGGVGSKGRKGFGSFADFEDDSISSVQDCQEHARTFRETCRLQYRKGETHSPALEGMMAIEVATPWKNPWTALDQLGYAVQSFAQKYAHKEEKKALGLPRRIPGPRKQPMHHQNYTHQRPKPLSADGIHRHASPAHYHLAKSSNGKLLIRAIALSAHRLPSFDESRKILGELLNFLEGELKQRARTGQSIGQREASRQPGVPPTQTRPGLGADLPKPNERVGAELLKEKTRKGGWRAKHLDSGLEGPIQDTGNVPVDAKPGQRVELTVAFANPGAMAFKWEKPRPPKKTSDKSGGKGYQRRWR